jgi:hypothetical protein
MAASTFQTRRPGPCSPSAAGRVVGGPALGEPDVSFIVVQTAVEALLVVELDEVRHELIERPIILGLTWSIGQSR